MLTISNQAVAVFSMILGLSGILRAQEKSPPKNLIHVEISNLRNDKGQVKPGTYAVSTFHDENSNGKLDTNLLGIPTEGVGASNNAKGHFGPPKFDDAKFRFEGGRLDLKIAIDYL